MKMKWRSVLLAFALLVMSVDSALRSSYSGSIGQVTEKCCAKGTMYARNHTSKDCKSSVPVLVAPHFAELCTLVMNECCYSYFDQKCDKGIDMALDAKKCDGAGDNLEKTCCDRCLQGKEAGTQGQICSRLRSSDVNEDFLPDEAYTLCCEKASKKEERAGSHPKNTTSSKIPIPLSTKYSICEEFAPNELCAHHCIAVPGSYRCECNPGFRLMADKKNCIADYNRSHNKCKTHNSCQHKCTDIGGGEIKCSCRKGYKLMADEKTCNDIDECINPHICPAGTKCRNYDGSYKCISSSSRKAISASKGECPPGFAKSLLNGACDDINECHLPRPPCPFESCENTIGGYKCDGVSGDPRNLDVRHLPQIQGEDKCPLGYKTVGNEECEDEDECISHQDNCNQMSQFCINTRGSFYCQDRGSTHCPQGFKINNKSLKCEDIDECLDDHEQSVCPGKICVNVPGAYDCKEKEHYPRSNECPDGMRKKYGSTVCEDINECVEGTHLCDQLQNCINTNGSHECHCKAGFKLDEVVGACVDVNECLTDQNNCMPESQRCDNTIGSFLCIRVMPCGTGYILHYSKGICEDIDECALGIHNCANQSTPYNCVNIPGSFRCVKPPSVASLVAHSDDEYYDEDYYDSDESTTTTQKSTPFDISLQPNVTIKHINNVPVKNKDNKETEAYDTKNNEIEVTKKEESTEENKTTPKRVFLNVPKETGTVSGVRMDDGTLMLDTKNVPKNVWTKIDVKPDNACQDGFEIDDSGACVDIDECATYRHDCKTSMETCHNNLGGYICECSIGFRRDLYSKACINALPAPISNNPLPSAITLLSRHTFNTDIPLSTVSSRVSTLKTTVPTSSSPEPSVSSTVASTNLDSEVESSTISFSAIPTTQTTTEKPFYWYGYPEYKGTYRPFKSSNLCDAGFHKNSNTGFCDDIDECMNGQALCPEEEVCVNTNGGYTCECAPTWVLDAAGHRCVPGRDRNKFPNGYGNLPGHGGQSEPTVAWEHVSSNNQNHVQPTITGLGNRGEAYKCPRGYKQAEDNSCQDINECLTEPSVCGDEQMCINLPGGYTCRCPPGHKLSGDQTCQDVDECDLAGDNPICSQNAECINTIGSYKCQCHKGFRNAPANDNVCMDVDECEEARSGSLCQHTCNNILGGYKCSCYRGYKLNADNKTCSDVNECEHFKDKHLCIGKCLNEPGSYRCTCPKGYRLSEDRRSCIDINECETGEAHCAAEVIGFGVRSFCLNVRGSFKCEKIACSQGYKLVNNQPFSSQCKKINQSCPTDDWNCSHQPVTVSYHYITLISHLDLRDETNLYTMKGPIWENSSHKFELRPVNVDAPPSVKKKADINSFLFRTTDKHAEVILIESLEGPQSIELELTMDIYFKKTQYIGKAITMLIIHVSEFDF